MSGRALDWARSLDHLSVGEKAVLKELAWRASDDAEYRCWPSIRRLASDAGVHYDTARRYLREMEEAGLVRRQAKMRDGPKGDGSQRANDYFVLVPDDFRQTAPSSGCAPPGTRDPAPPGTRDPGHEIHEESKASSPSVEEAGGDGDSIQVSLEQHFSELRERGLEGHRIRAMKARWLASPTQGPMQALSKQERVAVLEETLSRLLIEDGGVPSVPFIESGIRWTLDAKTKREKNLNNGLTERGEWKNPNAGKPIRPGSAATWA